VGEKKLAEKEGTAYLRRNVPDYNGNEQTKPLKWL
jgi:hypothetical protein